MRGKVEVEQVNSNGEIVVDYDTSISTMAMYERIKEYFPKIGKDSESMIVGEYQNKKYSIRAKNITYLGNPHPKFKKRIQISNDLQDFYNKSKSKGYYPILLGVYTYKDNYIFCEFNIEDFVSKKAHNSSAHVLTSDIVAATIDGFFQKIDYFNNRITVFRANLAEIFLNDIFQNSESDQIVNNYIIDIEKNKMPEIIIDKISEFFTSEKKEWFGIECYKNMIENNYKNKYQPEWAGFYLEYEFEKYINSKSLSRLVRYAQDKRKDGIDLDLYFPTIGQYGDLKAHSDYSKGIQGNDWNTVFKLIEKGQHIYYIICEHSTEKDRMHDYVVTKYWNTMQKKSNLMSYASKMKYSVRLKKAYILDINYSNKQYLSKFKQGINSNGKPREPKIMIDSENLKYFVIKEIDL